MWSAVLDDIVGIGRGGTQKQGAEQSSPEKVGTAIASPKRCHQGISLISPHRVTLWNVRRTKASKGKLQHVADRR